VPKSLLVNHHRNGLGIVLALSDQHVQSGYLFVFALNCFLKPCIVSLESIYINVRANRTTFASGGTRVKCCLRIGFGAFLKSNIVCFKNFMFFCQAWKAWLKLTMSSL
jgi:hypothetical protein